LRNHKRHAEAPIQPGEKDMRVSVRFVRLAAAAVAFAAGIWACGAGTAQAGDGGSDAGTIQTFLNSICGALGITSCPQLPTITQGTLEIAGLVYARPESIRRSQNIPPGSVFALNPPPVPANPVVPVTLPVTPSAFSNLGLTPLAFISAGTSTANAFAPVTQLFDPQANAFFSAVTTYGSVAGTPQPQTLNLFYEDLSRSNATFVSGREVAKISIPLVVYNDAACMANPSTGCAETPVPTVLDVRATCTGGAGCLTAYAIADFSAFGTQRCSTLTAPQTCTASDLGIGFALVFGISPASSSSHAIFEVQVPLVVTFANDPVHFSFSSPQSSIIGAPSFFSEDLGFPPAFLGGSVVGVATYPAPVCPGGGACPAPTSTFQSNFGFCASLPANNGNGTGLDPAVAAFLDIATDGEVLASAPLGTSTSPTLQCPF
jgi:hypothetical protein